MRHTALRPGYTVVKKRDNMPLFSMALALYMIV